MSVKLHARDHVHVTIAGVINDPAHLLRGESSLRGHKGIALHLNAGFRIKKVLVVLPSGEEIDLPSDLFLGGEGPVAHVHHRSAVSEGGPIVNFNFRNC